MRRVLPAIFVVILLAGLAGPVTSAAASAGDRYALIVGVGKFLGRTRPNPGSAGDAVSVTKFLISRGWPADHIRTLIDANADASDIRSGLEWLRSRCGPGTYCVFKYSGHVKQLSAGDGDSEVIDEALWPHDNSFIPDGEVAGYLKDLGGYAWIDISGCEAAGFDDGVSGPTRVFTASSQEYEKSYEDPVWANSIWTELLVDRAMAGNAADANHDGSTSLSEAFSFAKAEAAKLTAKQSKGPQHPYIAGGPAGMWFSSGAVSAPVAAATPPAAHGCLLLILLCY